MTIEYIRYRIDNNRRAEFVDAYRTAVTALDDSPQCLGYELSQCEEQPERFVLRIRWTSTTDHLRGFRSSEQFKRFFRSVQPYLDDIEEMQHYQPVDGLTRPQT
jgi:quinol monooxygenase YgiN